MPLDIAAFREEGGNLEQIKASQRARFASVDIVDQITEKDKEWRQLTGDLDCMRKHWNVLQKQIADHKKAVAKGEEPVNSSEQLAHWLSDKLYFDQSIMHGETRQANLKREIDQLVNKVGNIVLPSVPVHNNEEHNRVERVCGTPRLLPSEKLLNHHDLLWRIGGYEPERGANVAGHRGYFLRDVGVLLNQALLNYGIAFLRQRKYCLLQPPYLMKKEVMAGVAQLEQFDEELYSVNSSSTGATTRPGEERYLIATSEQPICAYHKGEWLDEKELPLLYAGVSTCFRKEAGSHGKDTWGIFRVHQFEKVEQFAIVEGDLAKSNAMQDEMMQLAETFYRSLEFPYRVVNIVSGALNNAAVRKLDLECWFPGYGAYRELVSCSNCTDYQSRPMEIRCGMKKANATSKHYVHMLNGTLCATGRAICCLLETHQERNGVHIPDVLVPFMGGITFLPFVRHAKNHVPDIPRPLCSPSIDESESKKTENNSLLDAEQQPAAAAASAKKVSGKKKTGIASIPDHIRAPPSYVSPAPTMSSQIVSLVTEHNSFFGDDGEANIAALEEHLAHYNYLGGDAPAAIDRRAYNALLTHESTNVHAAAHSNIARWLRHMATFPESSRSDWQ